MSNYKLRIMNYKFVSLLVHQSNSWPSHQHLALGFLDRGISSPLDHSRAYLTSQPSNQYDQPTVIWTLNFGLCHFLITPLLHHSRTQLTSKLVNHSTNKTKTVMMLESLPWQLLCQYKICLWNWRMILFIKYQQRDEYNSCVPPFYLTI